MLRGVARWGGLAILTPTSVLWTVTGLAMLPLVLGKPWVDYVMIGAVILAPVGHLLTTARTGVVGSWFSLLVFATIQFGLLSFLNGWI